MVEKVIDMTLCDADCPPVFIVMCIASVRKFISVFYLVTNIWFDVDDNAGTTIKIKSLRVHDYFLNEPTEWSQSCFLISHSISAPG